MNDRGGTVRGWMVMVAVLVIRVIRVICIGVTLHLLLQAGFSLDLQNPHG